MQIQFTTVFRKVPEGYIAFVEELPGLIPRAQHLLEANRALAEEDLQGEEVIRERILLVT